MPYYLFINLIEHHTLYLVLNSSLRLMMGVVISKEGDAKMPASH
ncbi:Uncharacterised protein [Legionella feeleii]|uniref:Uncharacterized protein n=1 Tax=Legionella feeleii TaxID=453 RepID=A0A378KL89_9GAMM|nr:Uncharacterised protein [Legionella feeleii]STX88287.1 Uncharacterised protein [Legionella feeleii]